jgi:hypothetical protein
MPGKGASRTGYAHSAAIFLADRPDSPSLGPDSGGDTMNALQCLAGGATARSRFPGRFAVTLLMMAACSAGAYASESPVAVRAPGNPDRVILQCTFDDYDARAVNVGGEDFQALWLPGEPVTTQAGAPQLPKVCRSIIIPDHAQMTLRILDAEYRELSARIVPSKGSLTADIDPAAVPHALGDAYRTDAFYPGELARLGTPYILRDYRGVAVELYPFQYNPVTGVLRVYQHMTVEVAAVGPGRVNVLNRARPDRKPSRAFHQVYKRRFVNYDGGGRYPPLDEEGDLLIIAYDPWIAHVEPLAAHKNSIGINTTVVALSTIGNDAVAIKNHIQDVYDTSDLAFVLLVGDADDLATPYVSGGSICGPADPTYGQVAGDDHYPDVMVGRLSAGDAFDVETQVERTIEYELNQATQQDWFWRGSCIGSDAQHLDGLRDALLAHGYTHVDQIYDPNATAATVADALNEGRGIVAYYGQGSPTSWGTSGFWNGDVNDLVNDNMLPFIVSAASLNGAFDDGTCFAEAWLRARHGSEPTGAIAAYMASGQQYWLEPLVAQQEFVNLYVNEAYTCFGTLCFAGACRMVDEYGAVGEATLDTWIVFGDPSLRVVGTVPQPRTWYVDDDAPNDPGPGDPTVSDPDEDGSAEHPFDAIQEGIDAASDGDTVLVLDGTYTGIGNKDLDFGGRLISVRSENGPEACIIDCEDDGRGFYFHSGEGADAVVEGQTITNGSADFGGGAICCDECSNPTFANCAIIANAAPFRGGGVYCDYNSSPRLANCTISGNSADWGGGVCCWDNSSPTLTDCGISGNSAGSGGGVHCEWYSSPTFTNCAISENSARDDGGGICSERGDPTLTTCTFSRNSAGNYGGGLHNYLGEGTLIDCTFSGNWADEGGGMCNYSSFWPMLIDCAFNSNSALGGAGMCNVSSGPTLVNCTFSGNSGGPRGGGMHNSMSVPTMADCTFSGNSADHRGGGIDNYLSGLTLTDCTFCGNWADHGGGMYNDESEGTLTSCAFNDNSADRGGGIYNGLNTYWLSLANCTFTGNSAGHDGGGILHAVNAVPRLANCTFGGNSAAHDGGGMYNDGGQNGSVISCTFSGNAAGEDGGGIYECTNPTLANCLFATNSATHGGAVHATDSEPLLTNCTFAGNSALNGSSLACDSNAQQHPSDVGLVSCILWNGGQAVWNNDDSTIMITYSDVQGGWPGIGNIDADPLFVDPDGPDNDPNTWEDNDYRLSAGSPCIDAGCNWAVPPDSADLDGDGDTDEITPLDLDGEGRFFDNPNTPDTGCGWPPIVDMGAYEFGGTGPQPCFGDLDNDRDVDLGDLATLLSHYGESEVCTGDLDCDGDVDLNDLNALLAVYGTACE